MKARPILFSAPMVQALLEGRKTQTRRIVKCPEKLPPEPESFEHNGWGFSQSINGGRFSWPFKCPHGEPGHLLWVRETFCVPTDFDTGKKCLPEYKATYRGKAFDGCWKPSIHMPRQLSRITLEITDIRVERLQDISEEDAKAEGTQPEGTGGEASAWFAHAWEKIHSLQSWLDNPWVWVIEFQTHKRNVDALMEERGKREGV